MDTIIIDGRKIGARHPPFIVAEMSNNHNQSLERALEIVTAAARAGAHALKLQTYTADTITVDSNRHDFLIDDPDSLWKGNQLYQLYQEANTPWEWHAPIFEKCRQLGLIPFSTPFDDSAVDFLESLDVPCYKIASFENNDLALIRKVASTGKPMIISTGMATVAELDETVRTARTAGCREIILLKCTSAYPASPESANLRTIPHMKELFACQVGLSDHSMGTGIAVASVALGATMIEKHFTLARSDGGVDAAFSIEPEELERLVNDSQIAWQAMGKVSYGPTDKEKASLKFRRSLYIVKDIRQGDVLDQNNLRSIRPGYGLAPQYYHLLLGARVNQDIKKGTPLSWDLVFRND